MLLSNLVTELVDDTVLSETDGEDHITPGRYAVSTGEYFTGSEDKILMNLKDLIAVKHHSDHRRLNGCCGLDGLDGLNLICSNGHEIGTEKSDCWIAHACILEPELVTLTPV